MKKERKEKHFIQKPYYEGGITAIRKYIKENLIYPKEALKNKIEGTVRVKYTVDYKGNVIEAKSIGSLGYGCDEEAIRLVKSLKFVAPKIKKGLRVKFHKSLNIAFKLPKQPTARIRYKYSTISKSKSKKTSNSYNYTITIS